MSAVLPAHAALGTEDSAQPAGGRRPAPRSRAGTGRSPRGAGRRPAPPPSGYLPVRRGARRPASSPGRAAGADGRRGGTRPGSGRPAAASVGRRRRGTEAAKSPPAEPERLPPRPAPRGGPARVAAPRRAGARPSCPAPRSSSRPRADARSQALGGTSSRSLSPESERHSLRGTPAPRGGPASQWPSGATPARVTKPPRRVPLFPLPSAISAAAPAPLPAASWPSLTGSPSKRLEAAASGAERPPLSSRRPARPSAPGPSGPSAPRSRPRAAALWTPLRVQMCRALWSGPRWSSWA